MKTVKMIMAIVGFVLMAFGCTASEAKSLEQGFLLEYAESVVGEDRVDVVYGDSRQPHMMLALWGQFSDGQQNGQRTVIPPGDKYADELRNAAQSYNGTVTDLSGKEYVGDLIDGVPNGYGTMTALDGSKLVSYFKNGVPIGQVVLTLKNGVFVGEFRKGRAHKGTFTGEDDIVISGMFGPEQSGEISYPDNRKYIGKWSADANLFGEKHVPGFWAYERPHGFGKMFYPDGTVKVGIWSKGEFVGKSPVE